eukprot:GHVU01040269.1.p1 GENE.GHVU01040269.1~~GHVU01040269.1.p1  ORF type:complete len:391 (-),score=48.35 GHVU01040269.1:1079-2251(-)
MQHLPLFVSPRVACVIDATWPDGHLCRWLFIAATTRVTCGASGSKWNDNEIHDTPRSVVTPRTPGAAPVWKPSTPRTPDKGPPKAPLPPKMKPKPKRPEKKAPTPGAASDVSETSRGSNVLSSVGRAMAAIGIPGLTPAAPAKGAPTSPGEQEAEAQQGEPLPKLEAVQPPEAEAQQGEPLPKLEEIQPPAAVAGTKPKKQKKQKKKSPDSSPESVVVGSAVPPAVKKIEQQPPKAVESEQIEEKVPPPASAQADHAVVAEPSSTPPEAKTSSDKTPLLPPPAKKKPLGLLKKKAPKEPDKAISTEGGLTLPGMRERNVDNIYSAVSEAPTSAAPAASEKKTLLSKKSITLPPLDIPPAMEPALDDNGTPPSARIPSPPGPATETAASER